MTTPLPDFANPPLAEVALSVQFETLTHLRTLQLGMLAMEWRDRFPKTEEHSPLDPVIERFGIARSTQPDIRFQVLEGPPVPRVWFLNEQGTELIQVQQDRFIHNWRKTGTGSEYPRYEHVRDVFRAELLSFRELLAREQIGDLKPNQCEVTYVNHIIADDGWEAHGQIENVLTIFQSTYSDGNLSEPEDARLAVRYLMKNEEGQPIGRLHVSAQPSYRRTDDRPMFVLTLTARGHPEGKEVEDILRFLDLGRDAIVRGFTSVTTPAMHRIWGKRNG